MPRPQPTATESTFDFCELFFSKTDATGRIQFGNNVFVRVSGYAKNQLIGAPHNVVRHPDMPRSIFKLFWAMLDAGKPVAAFVKNMTAKGDYYWVMAVACPVAGGYLSIRLRPSSTYFTLAQQLYGKLIDIERTAGMDGAYAALEGELRAHGFEGYEDFMTKALRAELTARDAAVGPRAGTVSGGQYGNISEITARGGRCFAQLFDQVDGVTRANESFSNRTTGILGDFNNLNFLSLNMMISAEHFGDIAASLSVISAEFQKKADVIETCVRSFAEAAQLVAQGIRNLNFNISSLKLQMEMVDFFVRESLDLNAFADINVNRADFLSLADTSADDLKTSLVTLLNKIHLCEKELLSIGSFARTLDVVRLVGRVEAARNERLQAAFTNQIEGLAKFTETVRSAITEFQAELRTLSEGVVAIDEGAGRGREILRLIFAAVPQNASVRSEDRSTEDRLPLARAAQT